MVPFVIDKASSYGLYSVGKGEGGLIEQKNVHKVNLKKKVLFFGNFLSFFYFLHFYLFIFERLLV